MGLVKSYFHTVLIAIDTWKYVTDKETFHTSHNVSQGNKLKCTQIPELYLSLMLPYWYNNFKCMFTFTPSSSHVKYQSSMHTFILTIKISEKKAYAYAHV